MRKTLASALLLLLPATVFAYPTARVFTPTGEALSRGTVCVFAYASANFDPSWSPGANWIGAQAGVLPQFHYGKGLRFGGLEVGVDVITPYANTLVKPVFNAKLGLVTEGTRSPAIAVGIVEISPALPSMNFVYVAATKTLQFGHHPSFGRLTLGLGGNTGSRAQFSGTYPFKNTQLALMAGYETPLIAKRLGFVVDYLGGASEISSTYFGAT